MQCLRVMKKPATSTANLSSSSRSDVLRTAIELTGDATSIATVLHATHGRPTSTVADWRRWVERNQVALADLAGR